MAQDCKELGNISLKTNYRLITFAGPPVLPPLTPASPPLPPPPPPLPPRKLLESDRGVSQEWKSTAKGKMVIVKDHKERGTKEALGVYCLQAATQR